MDLDADFQAFESAPSLTGSGNLKGMRPEYMDAFSAMAADYYRRTGKQLRVDDAFRTKEAQAAGYKAKPGLVAPPGHSLHERGLAMDINPDQAAELARMGLLEQYGFTRPMMNRTPGRKYEPWHVELNNAGRRAEKVAAKTKQMDLDADFEAFEKQTAAPQQAPPGTKVSAPGISPNVQAAYNKDFPREAPPEAPWYMRALKTAGEIAEKPGIKQALTVLNAPHDYISEPVAKVVSKVIPKGTVKMAPWSESGDLGEEYDFSPKEFVEKAGPVALDFPVYGAVGKALGWVGKAIKGKPAPPPTGMPTAVSEGIDLEERIAAAASVGGSPELGIEAVKPMATPSFLQPPTTPWVAGMTHPRLKGMTEGGYVQRSSVPGRTNPPETFPRPRVVPGINPTQYEFETARMGAPGFAPPSKMQPELPTQPLPVPMAPKAQESPWYSKGQLEDAIKAARDAKKAKVILRNIKGMKGMGSDEEVSMLLEKLGKLGGG